MKFSTTCTSSIATVVAAASAFIGCFATTTFTAAFVNNNNINNDGNGIIRRRRRSKTKTITQLRLISPLLLIPSYDDMQQQATTSLFPNQDYNVQQHHVMASQSSSSSKRIPTSSISNNNLQQHEYVMSWFQNNVVGIPPAFAFATETETSAAAPASSPPTNLEIQVLRQAFAAFYGTTDRNLIEAERLLTESINSWSRQPPDEQAGLYRVRGDCYMSLLRLNDAIADYTKTITLIQDSPGGDKADPAELPAAFLGRARAYRSMHTKITKEEAKQQVDDYLQALKLSSREEWDNEQELLEDGARTNPYATWEYGMALRLIGDYSKAQEVHMLASDYFDDIGDRARSVISAIDAGIDAASASTKGSDDTAKAILKNAIQRTKTVEGRDIPLLQRVIAKEGEGLLALASVLWTSGDKLSGESQLSLACQRLDQLEADTIARNKINKPFVEQKPKLTYNIDDSIVTALDINCGVIKNTDYLTNRLEWPTSLQEKASKLNKLG